MYVGYVCRLAAVNTGNSILHPEDIGAGSVCENKETQKYIS